MTRVMRAEQCTPVITEHGEGPVWDDREQVLHVVDMLAGDVLSLRDGAAARHHVGAVAAFVRPRAAGGLLVAVERGFALLDPATGEVETWPPLWTDPAVRMNEGTCDPQGRCYAGSMAYDASPGAGAVHRLDPDRGVELVLTGVTVSNGMAWSPSGEQVYYVDSATGRLDVLEFEAASGRFGGRRPLVTFDASAGTPDGITVDAGGGVWVALWGGGAVHRYTAQGVLDAVVEVPARQVTACAFGGPGLQDLFVTTSRYLLADPEASAGAVFRVRPGVSGLPVSRYAG